MIMQRLTMVRYATKPEASAENEKLSRAAFDQMRANAPDDVAYGLFRIGDEFIHLFVNLAADNSDAVTETSSFRAFQADLAARCTTPPQVTPLSVELVDSYGLGNA
jgi:hypothetical protein